jgi:tetratricopeptide (TPR) repeat protein
MRNCISFLPAALLLGAAPSAATADVKLDDAPQAVLQAASEQDSRLDKLFADLKRARNDKAAERIAERIQAEWSKSGSASIDLLMQWVHKGIKERKFAMALDFLDQVVLLEPSYAEGWNRRATIHFMMDNYAKSLRDLARTLQLEPRHFGALAGMAAIMSNTGRKQHALDAYQRALEVYPMLRSAQSEAVKLSEELAGEGI